MKVTVKNPMYAERNRYAFYIPEFLTYEGDRVPAPKWAPDDTVCLTTGNLNWPIRMLDSASITSIDDKTVVSAKVESKNKTVTVEGSKGQKYVVTITPEGKTCTCPGFGFRHSCKHVLAAN